ncbi:MAG: hypothetical protein ACI8QC_003789 [Planctomycetota bacterium]|jgi:hypothetical protein
MRLSLLATAVCLPFLASGCFIHIGGHGEGFSFGMGNGERVQGDGILADENRSVAGFDRVESMGSIEVLVSLGGAFGVQVSGDSNVLEHVLTEVEDGVLQVHLESGSYNLQQPLRVLISAPELGGVSSLGSGNLEVSGLDAGEFMVSNTGSGDLALSGVADHLMIRQLGSGNVFAFECQAQNVQIDAQGSGDVTVNASAHLMVRSVGSGDVDYSGNPEVETSMTGSGDCERVH